MRAALLGADFSDDPAKRLEFNRLQTLITHTDPKAEWCSRAIVELAALFCTRETVPAASEIIERIRFKDADASYRALLDRLETSLSENSSLKTLLERLGAHPQRGVSGYCFHTLVAVLHCGITHDWTPASALPAIWAAGGDTDTTGAILGALCGALHGPGSFPSRWIDGVMEFPTTITQFETFARATTELRPATNRSAFTPPLVLRNLIFLAVVLSHGFARLIPFRFGG
jgi:ADP-ribosylglycohydrolase